MVETHKSRSVLFIFSLILFAGLIVSALYLSFSKSAIIGQQQQLDTDIASLQTQIQQLKSQNIEAAQFAKQWLDQVEKDEILWSKVINTLQDLIPVDSITQKSKIQFLSYSGATGGKLTMNSQTIEGSADPYGDIAQLISTFNTSSFFADAYVPSISRGLSQAGNPILSFVFNAVYQEKLPEAFPLGSQAGQQIQVQPAVQSLPAVSSTQQPGSTTQVKVPRNK